MGKKTHASRLFPVLWCLEFVLGCGSGTISETCEVSCSPTSLSECASGKIRSCLPDALGCLNWSSWATCETGTCASAFSCSGCRNACAVSGDTRCQSGSLFRCEADVEGCLGWGAPIPCQTGSCANAERCAACDNACSSAGTTDCTAGKIRTCVADPQNCLAWDQPASCPSGTCLDDKTCFVSTATLLWSDQYSLDDARHGSLGAGGSGAGWGDFNGWYCQRYEDSISIVDARTLNGARPGYVAKFKQHANANCGSPNLHSTMETSWTQISTVEYPEQWWGFSVMLDPSWVPWTAPAPSVYWQRIGLSVQPQIFEPNKGGGVVLERGAGNPYVFVGNNQPWEYMNQGNGGGKLSITNQWYDFMYHIKWCNDACPNNGFFELYVREPGESDYKKVWAQYNYRTLHDLSQAIGVRAGAYRGTNPINIDQVLYVGFSKIGLTRADVEYGREDPRFAGVGKKLGDFKKPSSLPGI